MATFAKDQPRVNERIRIPQVRVIGDDGQQIGIVPTAQALAMAQERGLDLVEISPTARPPVCKIMDYGRYKYEQSKREKEAKKKQHVSQLKEVKLRPKIETHDYGTKLSRARRFLEEKHKVKFTVMFRGREMAYPERGRALLERVLEELADVASAETVMRHEGRTLTITVLPKPARSAPRKEKSGTAPGADERVPSAPRSTG